MSANCENNFRRISTRGKRLQETLISLYECTHTHTALLSMCVFLSFMGRAAINKSWCRVFNNEHKRQLII